MATKKIPALTLHARCISARAFTHDNILKVVRFDGAGHLLCTDSGGGWAAWRLEDGERVRYMPCLAPTLRKPGPLRPLRPGAWMGWDGASEQLAALDVTSAQSSPLPLPAATYRVGERLVTVLPNVVELRDPESLALRATLAHRHALAGMIAGEGDFIVCFGADGRSYVTVKLAVGELHRLALSGTARPLAVRGRDGLILAHDDQPAALLCDADGERTRRLATRTRPTVAVFSVEDDALVFCGDGEGCVRCVSLEDGQERWRAQLECHLFDLTISPDGRMLAAAVGQRALLLDARTGEQVGPRGPVWPPTALSFGSQPLTLCASPSRGQLLPVKYVHLMTPGEAPSWRPIAGALAHAAGEHVVMADEDAALTRALWAAAPPAARLPGQLGLGTGALAVGAAGEVVRGRYDVPRAMRVLEVVRIDAASGAQQVTELAADKKRHPALCAHSAGERVVVGAETKEVLVYDIATGALVHTLSGLKRPATRVALSPDGCFVAAVESKTVMCWPLEGGSAWAHKLDDAAACLCFTPDAASLIVGVHEAVQVRHATLYAWRSADGQAQPPARAPWLASTTALACAPDGALYAAGGDLNIYQVELPELW